MKGLWIKIALSATILSLGFFYVNTIRKQNIINEKTLEYSKQRDALKLEGERYERYRQECLKMKEGYMKDLNDFMDTCTSAGSSVDNCANGDTGKALYEGSGPTFLAKCIENKMNLIY